MHGELIDKVCKRFGQLEASRGNWEEHWEEVAELIWPTMSQTFHGNFGTQGEKRTEKMFDAQPALALDRFASALQSMLVPEQQKWHRMKASNADLMRYPEVDQWFEQLTNVVFARRYVPAAAFNPNIFNVFKQQGAFGTGVMFLDEYKGMNRYKACNLADTFIDMNHQCMVDTVYRRMRMTARQIVQMFGPENVPVKVTECLENDAHKTFKVMHCVRPRDDYSPGTPSPKGKAFQSLYIMPEYKHLLREGGYSSMPYVVGRYEHGPDEIYGRSPAMLVLPDIKMLHEMSKTMIRAAHKAVDPPMLVHDDGILGGGTTSVDLRPAGVNYGGVSPEGRQLIQPLQSGVRPDISQDLIDSRQRTINDAFLVTLFQILVETPEMTATEALIRAQEKGALLSPAMGRQRSELLSPMIEREVDLVTRAGLLPPAPPILQEARGEYSITFDSPLTRMQEAEELVGIQRTMEIITPIAQFDPSILKMFDYQEVAKIARRVTGAPASIVKTDEQVQAEVEQDQEMQMMQQIEQAIPTVSGATKDFADAQAKLAKAGLA